MAVAVALWDGSGNREDFTYDSTTGWLSHHKRTQAGTTPVILERSFERDLIGRVTTTRNKHTGQSDLVSTYGYDSVDHLVRMVDPAGYVTSRSYRLDGKISVASQDVDDTRVRTHLYAHSNAGLLTAVTDDRGSTIYYSYDGQGRVKQETHPDGTSWKWTWNQDGFLATETDSLGRLRTFLYGPDGYPASATLTQGSSTLQTKAYQYTPGGYFKRIDKTEYPTGGSPISSFIEVEPDSAGRIWRENQNGTNIYYGYDTLGRLLSITGPQGYKAQYGYDTHHRVTSLKDAANNVLASFSYVGPAGALASRSLGDGSTMTVTRGAFGRTTGLTTLNGTATIADFQYGYDSRGLLEYEDRIHDGKGDAYSYDRIGRLRGWIKDSVNASAVDFGDPNGIVHDKLVDYSLDDDHHRSSVTTTPFKGQASSESYTPHGTRSYYTNIGGQGRSHDNAGNLLTHGTRSFSYDHDFNLIEVKDGTTILGSYSYDAAGRRSTKTVGSKITRYVYAGAWIILEEESTNSGQSWTTTAENYHGTSVDDVVMSRRLDIADLDQDQSTSDWVDLYYHKNIQGSTMLLTLGSTGAVVESYHYSPFGKTTIQDRSGNVANAPPSGNTFLYTGREYDSETGYYYYRARTYDPNTGDFLQEDPKGLAAGINPQVYVVGNPIAFTDPFGAVPWSQITDALAEFIAEVGQAIIGEALSAIPGVAAVTDVLSAVTGSDYSEWLEGGFSGEPEAISWWWRGYYAASAAVRLVGSAAGFVKGLAKLLNKIYDAAVNSKAGKKLLDLLKNKTGICISGRCFLAGTLVLLPGEESVSIESIEPGAQVQTASPHEDLTSSGTHDQAFQVDGIKKTWHKGFIITLIVEGPKGRAITIQGTPEHPFYCTSKQEWIALGSLNPGDILAGRSGPARVTSTRPSLFEGYVYNLSVLRANSYRVGPLGLLVHNACPRRTKHIDNRHVDRKKHPGKTKYKKPNQINKLNKKTMGRPDRVTRQGNGNVKYERDFGRGIGTGGESTNTVIVNPAASKIVTSFPSGG